MGVSAGTAFPGGSAFGAHPGGESSGADQVELLLGDQVPPPMARLGPRAGRHRWAYIHTSQKAHPPVRCLASHVSVAKTTLISQCEVLVPWPQAHRDSFPRKLQLNWRSGPGDPLPACVSCPQTALWHQPSLLSASAQGRACRGAGTQSFAS